MDTKYLARIGVTILILALIIGVLYYGAYMPYKWELSGVVADADGDFVEGAEVKLTIVGAEHMEEEGVFITTTDENGDYKFSSNILKRIPPGVYIVNVSTFMPDGRPYVGHTSTIKLTGTDIKQNLLWIRSKEIEVLAKYDDGMEFLTNQVRANDSDTGDTGGGTFWVRVDLTELGDEYGIQIENAPGNNISMNLMRNDRIVRPGKHEINNSRVVDVDPRSKGRYPQFLNCLVFAGLGSAELTDGVYRLTATQRDIILAPVTTGVLAEDIYDKEGNWVSQSEYADMTIMSRGYFDRYFEVVKEDVVSDEIRIEYKCKDDEYTWRNFKASCTITQHCDNRIATKYGYECTK